MGRLTDGPPPIAGLWLFGERALAFCEPLCWRRHSLSVCKSFYQDKLSSRHGKTGTSTGFAFCALGESYVVPTTGLECDINSAVLLSRSVAPVRENTVR
jgi:hypothetical protein